MPILDHGMLAVNLYLYGFNRSLQLLLFFLTLEQSGAKHTKNSVLEIFKTR